MSCNWPKVALGKYCSKIGSGATPKGGNSVYLDSGEITLIRSQNIYNEGFKSDGLVYITPEAAQKLKNVIIEPNDVLINITGDSVARVCLAPKEHLPARVNQHVAIIRVDPKEFDHRYLRYYLTSLKMQSYLLTIASSGATRNALTKLMLESLEVSKPPLDIQKKIGDVLEQFENKIQLNTQTNQTLEQMAQAIFKSWFVDFDPVKAKMNGEQPEGMDAATASLFPEKLVESELGLIPEGWNAGTVGSVTSAKGGYAFKSKQFIEEGNPVIKIKNITSTGTVTTSDCQCVDDDIAKTASRFKLSDGDLLMAMTGATVGKSGIYVSDGRDGYLNQRVARFESKVNKFQPCWFTYNLVNRDSIFEQIVGAAQGSAQPNISSNGIEQVKTVVPTFDLIHKYQEVVSPLYAKWISNFRENSHLSELRDTLLPKLLSGDIELSAEL
ncbi:restriction endonuclease subunit S [Vibrio fluvialis]